MLHRFIFAHFTNLICSTKKKWIRKQNRRLTGASGASAGAAAWLDHRERERRRSGICEFMFHCAELLLYIRIMYVHFLCKSGRQC